MERALDPARRPSSITGCATSSNFIFFIIFIIFRAVYDPLRAFIKNTEMSPLTVLSTRLSIALQNCNPLHEEKDGYDECLFLPDRKSVV